MEYQKFGRCPKCGSNQGCDCLPMPETMGEYYGDDSDCKMCPKCTMCVTHNDCVCEKEQLKERE